MNKPIIAITMAEAAGIAPEILVKAFMDESLYEVCRPLIVGDYDVMKAAVALVKSNLAIHVVKEPADGMYQFGTIDLIDMDDLTMDDFKLGEPNAATGRAMLGYTREAVRLYLAGKVDGLVGGPHSKYAAELAGEYFDGYPGLIANMTDSKHPYLMLSNGKLCVSNVTLHTSLRKGLAMLDEDLVYHCIKETEKAVQAFGIAKPRIAVCGLNPHAGENRMFGDEDEDIIKPAILRAKEDGIEASGPYPADSLFVNCLTNNRFDAYVAMYHDQAHLPVKALVFDQSSAVAIGVPVNWATCDHGCALDIAWTNVASPSAIMATIKLIARRAGTFRQAYEK